MCSFNQIILSFICHLRIYSCTQRFHKTLVLDIYWSTCVWTLSLMFDGYYSSKRSIYFWCDKVLFSEVSTANRIEGFLHVTLFPDVVTVSSFQTLIRNALVYSRRRRLFKCFWVSRRPLELVVSVAVPCRYFQISRDELVCIRRTFKAAPLDPNACSKRSTLNPKGSLNLVNTQRRKL